MKHEIAPSYLMKIVNDIKEAIWEKYSSYVNVRYYVEKWYECDDSGFGYENFRIYSSDNGTIDLLSTLHGMDGDLLIKIAIDLGVETPDFIPAVPVFRNSVKQEYSVPAQTFEKAFNLIEEQPDIAIGLTNSALEGIIKQILSHELFPKKLNRKLTLYDLASELLKELQLFPHQKMPVEVKTLGSSLLKICQMIEKLRSDKTNLHGKTGDEIVITDSIYTYFIVNSVATIGLFLMSIWGKITEAKSSEVVDYNDDIPF